MANMCSSWTNGFETVVSNSIIITEELISIQRYGNRTKVLFVQRYCTQYSSGIIISRGLHVQNNVNKGIVKTQICFCFLNPRSN